VFANAQQFVHKNIPFLNGTDTLKFATAGGLNLPQFSDRYGINKRWELGGGGDVIIPAFNIGLKLNSTFLLLDKDKYKLGLFTQAFGSAGFP
jgi:hypothetical protein